MLFGWLVFVHILFFQFNFNKGCFAEWKGAFYRCVEEKGNLGRSVFRAGVSLNIHSFIGPIFIKSFSHSRSGQSV